MPVIVALNMVDEASAAGLDFDTKRLGRWLGATVVPTVASQRKGLDRLQIAIADVLALAPRPNAHWTGLPEHLEAEVVAVSESLQTAKFGATPAARRSWALWALLSLDGSNEDETGLLIASVDPDGPAGKAGLKRGDIVVQAGDAHEVRRADAVRDLEAGRVPEAAWSGRRRCPGRLRKR